MNSGIIQGKLSVCLDPITNSMAFYDGIYEVIPTLNEQELNTKNTILQDNIKIAAIPEEFSSKDSNTTDATAEASEILTGKSAYVNKQKIIGSMPDNGAIHGEITSLSENYSVAKGYHNGEGTVNIKSDTLISENIKSGVNILGVQGTFTSDAIASSQDILETKTAYVNADKIVGSMPNRGAVQGFISNVSENFSISAGYHNGLGIVAISSEEQVKIISENIKAGISILGVLGTYRELSLITPYQINVYHRYITGNSWKYNKTNTAYSDLYSVEQGHVYLFVCGSVVSDYLGAIFLTQDPFNYTDITGIKLLDVSSPSAYECFIYNPETNGYIAIQKCNSTLPENMKIYLYDITSALQ